MHFPSAGERVFVESRLPWVTRIIAGAAGLAEPHQRASQPAAASPDADVAPDPLRPSVHLRVESDVTPFNIEGLRLVTRGAFTDGHRTVLINVGGSGFDLLVAVATGDELVVTARYRPGRLVRMANLMLPRRFGLLAGQVLVHYPVLWRASWRGRVPLHVSVVTMSAGTTMIVGPGGVGKSTLIAAALRAGAQATADNLCCADDIECFGLAEPMRVDATIASGDRTSHGRVAQPMERRADALTPDRLVVLERGAPTRITAMEPEQAARSMVAGTYAAGELRRYWAFSATLALATGRGPAHPPIADTALRYAFRLPCLRMQVCDGDAAAAATLCGVGGPVTR
jgi:hypothetical protein